MSRRIVRVDGHEYRSIREAAEAYGIPKGTVQERVRIYGWDVARALQTPPNAHLSAHRTRQVEGDRQPLSAEARRLRRMGVTDDEGAIIMRPPTKL